MWLKAHESGTVGQHSRICFDFPDLNRRGLETLQITHYYTTWNCFFFWEIPRRWSTWSPVAEYFMQSCRKRRLVDYAIGIFPFSLFSALCLKGGWGPFSPYASVLEWFHIPATWRCLRANTHPLIQNAPEYHICNLPVTNLPAPIDHTCLSDSREIEERKVTDKVRSRNFGWIKSCWFVHGVHHWTTFCWVIDYRKQDHLWGWTWTRRLWLVVEIGDVQTGGRSMCMGLREGL